MRNQLLIVYSREDEKWAQKLLIFLRPLVRASLVTPWTERDLLDGAAAPDGFKEVLSSARAVVFLLSADFLASPLMCAPQIGSLLEEAARDGARITWVTVSACAYKASPLMIYQAAFNPSKPLNSLKSSQVNEALVQILDLVMSLLEADEPGVSAREQTQSPPAKGPEISVPQEPSAPPLEAAGGEHTFICYAREDSGFVVALASDLKAAGINVWLDQWDIPSGADWDYEIDKALYDCRHFLIVLSPEAVNSEEVRSELRAALNERKRIVPVLYKTCRIPRRLTLIQYTDFTSVVINRSAALRQIVSALGLKNP